MRSFKEHLQEANTTTHAAGATVAFPHKGKMTTGKVVRYEKGGAKLAPHYVISHGETESAKVPPHKVEKYAMLDETVDTEKFQRATKTAVHYTGMINDKTYVVPHSFHGHHDVLHGTKTTEIRHAIVTSPHHIQHNNPDLSPEEVTRIHSHIKDIHGVQAPSKYDSFGKLEEETHSGLTPPSKAFKSSPENKPVYDLLARAKREKVKAERPMRKGAADRFLRRFGESQELEEGKKAPNPFKVGDKVQLHPEALKHHAQSVPAHAGYSKEGFAWREHLGKLQGHVGTVSRVFPDSGHTNVDFHNGTIGIEHKSLVPHSVKEEYEYPDPKPRTHGPEAAHDYEEQQASQDRRERDIKPEKSAAYKAERDVYRHKALHASRKAATLAFAKKHHIINEKEAVMNEASPSKFRSFHAVATHHQTKIAKQTLRMPDAMVGVMGGGTKEDARAHLKKVGWTDKMIHHHEHGPGDSTFHHLDEAAPKKEETTHAMKPHSFKDHIQQLDELKKATLHRYIKKAASDIVPKGHEAKEFARKANVARTELGRKTYDDASSKTYNKQYNRVAGIKRAADRLVFKEGKELVDGLINEEVHAYDVHHKGKHIDTIFYGHPEPVESVKRSLVNHDGYHPDITVRKQAKKPGQKLTSARWDAANKHLEEAAPFMTTYKRNESANRHTANVLHLAKHFGTKADQEVAQFHADELKRHGHNKHHEASYELHKKLWPMAVKAHSLTEAAGLSFKDAINVAKKSGHKVTYGTASNKWHTIDAKDRDFHTTFALDPHTAERHGEVVSRRVSSSPRHLEETKQLDELNKDTLKTVKSVLAEASTREHFRRVAEVIKRISDAKERQEIADHNAALFAKQNPRFDHAKFHAAAGTVHKKD